MGWPGTDQQVAHPPLETTPSPMERQIGNYRLTRSIGRGPWGEVYLGEHGYAKTLRAIKICHTPCSEQARQRFLCQAQVLAGLEHPHLVRLYDYGLHEGTPYLVMSYAPNGSIRDLAPLGTRLAPARFLPLLKQIASALDALHEQQVLHQGLTPENILLGLQGQALLSDIGLASVLRSAESPGRALGATAAYAAPELVLGQPCCRSDQYALGIMVYEWLCGTCPFTGTAGEIAAQQALCPLPSLCQQVAGLAPLVEEVLFQALAKEPAQRYESVTAFASALEAACQQTAPGPAKHARAARHVRGPALLRVLAQRLLARWHRRS